MSATDYPIRHAAEIDATAFRAVLAAARSPALAESDAIYGALVAEGVSVLVWLGFGWVESKLATTGIVAAYRTRNMGNVRSPEVPGAATIVQTPRGPFASYPTWAAGARDWAARLTGPKYAGRGLTTLRTVIPVYAPGADSNDPESYIAAVLARIAAWGGTAAQAAQGGRMTVPQPTVISRPSPNRGGYASPHDPQALCLHITAGSGASALSWLTNPASQVSANYLNLEDGTLYELVPPTASAWANGAVNKPNMANPVIARALQAGRNLNTATISVENAGQTSAGRGGSLSAAQVRSLIALCAWLCQRFGIPPDRDHIIPHAYVDSVNRPYCPGFSETEWASWVGQIAALVRGATTPTTAPAATIAGGVQPGGGDVRIPAAGVTTVEVVDGQVIVATNYGPDERDVVAADVNTVEQHVTVTNRDGNRYNRSERDNVMQGFVALPK